MPIKPFVVKSTLAALMAAVLIVPSIGLADHYRLRGHHEGYQYHQDYHHERYHHRDHKRYRKFRHHQRHHHRRSHHRHAHDYLHHHRRYGSSGLHGLFHLGHYLSRW